MVWVGLNRGEFIRFEENDNMSGRGFERERPMPMRVANDYGQACGIVETPGDGFIANFDFDDILILDDRRGYAVNEGCAVIHEFEPKPDEDSLESQAFRVYSNENLRLGEQWPAIDGRLTDMELRVAFGQLWVGGGAVLRTMPIEP